MSSLWNTIRAYLPFGGRRYVGKDLEGNKFYEYLNPTGGRTRRVIKYRYMAKMNDYTSGKHHPPIQWKAWLSHTRSTPPTLAELQTDHSRQSTLLNKIATIEAREKEERIRQGFTTEHAPGIVHSGAKFGAPGSSRIRAPPSFVPKSQALVEGDVTPEGGVAGHSVGSYDNLARAKKMEEEAGDVAEASSSAARIRSLFADPPKSEYPVPTPPSPAVPPPADTVEPAQHASKDDLRKLAEEDTKRRIAKQGGEVTSSNRGVEGVGMGMGGLQPRRRGKAT